MEKNFKIIGGMALLSIMSYGIYKSYQFHLSEARINPYKYHIPHRKWRKVADPTKIEGKSFKMRVLSYNVLADAYTKGLSNISHYPGKKANVLQDFEYRSQRVMREIVEGEVSDIICLQEIDHYDSFY